LEADRTITRAKAYRESVALLRGAGIPNPTLDASVLLGHVTAEMADTVLLEGNKTLAPDEAARFKNLVARRCDHEVLSRLIGTREFYSRAFRVTCDVFDPRPETEILVEQALACLKDLPGRPMVLDVGTGTGAIAVTIAAENPRIFVTATDINSTALRSARMNAGIHGVADRIRFIRTDLAQGLKSEPRFDLVVSNPPYISQEEYLKLPPEVLRGDPATSLVAGHKGTEFYRPIVQLAREHLRPGGYLVVEMGAGQSSTVIEIFRSGGLEAVEVIPDLARIPRVVKGARCRA
jgi:release factor glutamine methyltransferase